MFIIMILAYGIILFLDLKATYHNQDKAKLIAYFTLMTISCAISIASLYVRGMPGPAEPIKLIIFKFIGK